MDPVSGALGLGLSAAAQAEQEQIMGSLMQSAIMNIAMNNQSMISKVFSDMEKHRKEEERQRKEDDRL
jgi:hypothetical protein